MSSAGENCVGLDTALRNNLTFIADQRANPDALSQARIANRQAVVDLINQRRATAGGTADVAAPPAAKPPAAAPPAKAAPAAPPAGNGGDVVCKGSTVTLSGEAGAPFASSGTLPLGTTLKVDEPGQQQERHRAGGNHVRELRAAQQCRLRAGPGAGQVPHPPGRDPTGGVNGGAPVAVRTARSGLVRAVFCD
jgi:hypothetical protein